MSYEAYRYTGNKYINELIRWGLDKGKTLSEAKAYAFAIAAKHKKAEKEMAEFELSNPFNSYVFGVLAVPDQYGRQSIEPFAFTQMSIENQPNIEYFKANIYIQLDDYYYRIFIAGEGWAYSVNGLIDMNDLKTNGISTIYIPKGIHKEHICFCALTPERFSKGITKVGQTIKS